MSRKANYFKIGAFVIIGFAIAVIGIVVFGAGKFFRHKIMIETYLNQSVQGLNVGAPLKYQGVQVGNVTEIGFAFNYYPTPYTYVVVRAEIQQELVGERKSLGRIPTEEERVSRIKELIEQGFRLQLDSQGITGVAFLNMVHLDPKRFPPLKIDWEPESLYIPSAPGVITQITEAIENLTGTLETIDIKGMTDKVNQILVNTDKAIEDAQIPLIAQDIRELLEVLENSSKRLDSILHSKEVQQTLTNLSQTLENINTTSRKVSRFTSSERHELDRIIEDLRVTTENLRELTDTAKRYPSWFLFGNPPPPLNEVKQ
ncbi:MAG: paraquat-inducible ABC-type transporter [Candidatus Dadabacteria bacterium CSP1-2]|nr:MAG: paraquat-inducible ABC-type transporter [Candidatus Dadabacteria bacterium CSP1-2]